MPRNTDLLPVDEWFEQTCGRLGVDPDDLIHPADVDHEDAEFLIGARVLLAHHDPGSERRDEYEVLEIRDLPTAGGEEQTFAVWAYRMGDRDHPVGMNIEIDDRDALDEWDKQVRFIPSSVEIETQGPEAAIERLRNLPSSDSLHGEDAQDIAQALGGDLDPEELHGDTLSVPIFLKRMVIQITDEDAISGQEYFGRAIGGHKKADRGAYKGNLTILEEHVGLEPTYSRSES